MSFEGALNLNVYSIVILTILLFNLFFKYGINNKVTKIFAAILFLTIGMLLFDIMGRQDGLSNPSLIYFNKIGNTVSFILSPVLPSLWLFFIIEVVSLSKKKRNQAKVVVSIAFFLSLILTLLSIFAKNDNYFFYIGPDNIYVRGKLFFLSVIYTGVIVIISSLLVLLKKKEVDKRLFYSLFVFPIAPVIGIALQSVFYGTSFILNGVTISALIVHLHLQAIQMNTDYLTKIYNRRKLISKLTDEVKKAKPDHSFCGILIDIVEFKNINDYYGHLFGDKVLIRTAEILKNIIGPFNFVYRYGGDEFFIIINSSKEKDAENYIEKIKREISNYNMSIGDKFKLELTFGSLIYDPINKLSVEEYLEKIDQLMYNNKNYDTKKTNI